MKTINGTTKFPLFTRLAKFLSLLPHSNADTEGIFRKIWNRVLYVPL